LKINIASQKFPEYHQYPFIRSSDAHNLDDIGRGTTTFRLKEASFKELKYALKGYAGRGIYN
jgi:PHP family Zn ribbon phosphoesterase